MSTEKTPFRKGVEGTKNTLNKTEKIFRDTTGKLHTVGRNAFRYQLPPVQEEKWWKRTPYKIGNIADAVVGTPLRRVPEITEPIASGLGSLYYTTLRVPFNPINTLFHPIKYGKNLLNIPFSTAVAAKNVITAPLRILHDVAERGIERPLEYTNQTVDNIPVVGEPIAKITNTVAKGVSNVVNFPIRAADYVTSPIEATHKYLAA